MAQARTRRQHYLPCFVQNGFAFEVVLRQKRRKYRVHVFRRDRASETAYTSRVGFADDFYCRPDEANVEDALADEEAKRFTPLVRALRRGTVPAERAGDIPAFVAHMIVRTQ